MGYDLGQKLCPETPILRLSIKTEIKAIFVYVAII